MANVVTFHVFGDGGRVFITKNNAFIGIASPGFDVTVTYEIGDYMGANCVPFLNYSFVKLCDNLGQECDTNPVQNRQITGNAVVTLNAYFAMGSPDAVTITQFIVGADNYPETRTRNFAVKGTGQGTYQIKEGSTVITTRTLPVSGFDQFDLTNIPEGPHTYCAQLKCATFTIVTNPKFDKWSCNDGCNVADTTGTYNSQAECKTACQSAPGLYVDGKQGSAKVALDKPVTLKVQGIGANKSIRIDNISATPDEIVAQGTTNADGIFETTVTFSTNASFQLRGYYNCVAFVCANETNTVNVQAGDGDTNWLMYAVIIGLLVVVFFYSKELGLFKAIRKR